MDNEFPFNGLKQQYTLVHQVSHDQAHEVAMQAAMAASRTAQELLPPTEIAQYVTATYKEAYCMVEGWHKPTMEEIIARDKACLARLKESEIPLSDPLHPDYKRNFGGDYDVK